MKDYNIIISEYSYEDYNKSRIPLTTADKYRNTFVLLFNNSWNDMGYYSEFFIVYFDNSAYPREIGLIKLFRKDMKRDYALESYKTYYFLKLDKLIEIPISNLPGNYYSILGIETYNYLSEFLKGNNINEKENPVNEFLLTFNEISVLDINIIKKIEKNEWFKDSLLRDFNISEERHKMIVSFTKLKHIIDLKYNSYYLLKNFSKFISKLNHENIIKYFKWVDENKHNMRFEESKEIVKSLEELKKNKINIKNELKKKNATLIRDILTYFRTKFEEYTEFTQRIDTFLEKNNEFHKLINSIKNSLIINKEDLDDDKLALGHYTSLSTLKKLIKPEKSYLRLTNARQLNDPLEGKFISTYLAGNTYDNIWLPTQKFISSMTTRKDSLPMWNHYGDNATGAMLIYDNQYLKEILDIDCIEIYKVAYVYIDETKKLRIKKTDNIDNKTVKSLERDLKKLKKIKNLEKNTNFLQEIDFLFKKSEFSYENEYRIIANIEKAKENELKQAIEDNMYYNVPFVYQYITNNDKSKLRYSELILGPKALNIDFISPYIKACDDNIEIKKSEINFR